MQKFYKAVVAVLLLAGMPLMLPAQLSVVTSATISTTYGDSFTDDQLRDWITEFIPTNAEKCIILTQCLGGTGVTKYDNVSNTVVLSAGSKAQSTYYGYYEKGAFRGMRPGSNRTAQTIHDEGKQRQHWREDPTNGGSMTASDFSLQSVNATGDVQQRQIIFYAGIPDHRPGRDVAQLFDLPVPWYNEDGTTIQSVGGETNGSFGRTGSAEGMRNALRAAGNAMTNAADPSKTQLILFISDHGDHHYRRSTTNKPPVSQGSPMSSTNFNSVSSNSLERLAMQRDNDNVPGLSFFVPLPGAGHPAAPGNYTPYFNPSGQFVMQFFDEDNPGFNGGFPIYWELPMEVDDGIIGNVDGEGVRIYFPIQEEFWFEMMDRRLTIQVLNTDTQDVWISEISMDSGEVSKLYEPTMYGIQQDTNDPTRLVLAWDAQTTNTLQHANTLSSGTWSNISPEIPTGGDYAGSVLPPGTSGYFRAAEIEIQP